MRQSFSLESLNIRMIFAVTLVFIITLLIMFENNSKILQSQVHNFEHDRILGVHASIKSLIYNSLIHHDTISAQLLLENIRSEHNLDYVVLLDKNNQLLASSGWNMQDTFEQAKQDLNSGHFYWNLGVTGNRDSDSDIQATLHYGVNNEYFDDLQKRIATESFFIVASGLLFTIILLIFKNIYHSNRIKDVLHASKELTLGNLNYALTPIGKGEWADLYAGFNNMAKVLQKKFESLNKHEKEYYTIANQSYNWESWYSHDAKLIWVNPAVERTTGYSIDECMEMDNFVNHITIDNINLFNAQFGSPLTGDKNVYIKFRICKKTGETAWITAYRNTMFDPLNQHLGYRFSFVDTTSDYHNTEKIHKTLIDLQNSTKKLEAENILIRNKKVRLKSILTTMKTGVLLEDDKNKIKFYNPTLTQLLSIDDKIDLIDMHTSEVIRFAANVLVKHRSNGTIFTVSESCGNGKNMEFEFADGRIIRQYQYSVPTNQVDKHARLWLFDDVTRERQIAEHLVYLAERDSLTGLYNRRRFQEELNRILESSARRKSHGALLFFDLDEFKYINDMFGHRAGDSMLVRISHEVKTLIRRNEIFCRLGGDEFAVLLPDATKKGAQMLAKRIINGISQIPFLFESHNIRVTTSIGIALYPEHATEQEELTSHADSAMYQAKGAGKNAWRLYTEELSESHQLIDRLTWNNNINHAIKNKLFKLHLQGIYNVKDGNLCHIEILIRMLNATHPELLVMPRNFIPFAEKTGRILDIDRWVVHESISMLAQTEITSRIPVSINISGRSFDDISFSQYIIEQLEQFNIPTQQLLLEITESAAMSDINDAQRFIKTMHKAGCKVCLDDFGTGFSSFTYLKYLQADILKIDGQFTRDLPNNHASQVFIKAIVDVARGLEKQTIAESIEDEETFNIVRDLGVDMVQGYLFDTPNNKQPRLNLGILS